MSIVSATSSTGESMPGFITPDGVVRLLGALPSGNRKMAAPAFTTAHQVIPRSEWKALKRPRGPVPILDQGQHGSCVGHGSDGALMLVRNAAGMTYVKLSPTYIYAQINGNRDAGADLADAADELVSTGTCTFGSCGEDTIFTRDISAAANAEASRFKALKIYQCNTFDEAVSAWLLGGAVFDSVRVGNGFNSLNSDGCPPVSRGFGNHCVRFADELKQTSGGNWIVEHANSWDTTWGLGGYFFMGENAYDLQPDWQAFAIMAVATDPQDPRRPPVLA